MSRPGRLDGPYSVRRADHPTWSALLPDDEFVALARFPDHLLT
jgi:hypothetical protein